MDPQDLDLLHTLAEVSIGLIGFTGIVVALQHRGGRELSSTQVLTHVALVGPSLTALFGCFIPELMNYAGLNTNLAWRSANAILGLLHLSSFVFWLYIASRLGANKATPGQKLLSIVSVIVIISHLLAAWSVLPWLVLVYVVGLLEQIGVGLYNFVLSLRTASHD